MLTNAIIMCLDNETSNKRKQKKAKQINVWLF